MLHCYIYICINIYICPGNLHAYKFVRIFTHLCIHINIYIYM